MRDNVDVEEMDGTNDWKTNPVGKSQNQYDDACWRQPLGDGSNLNSLACGKMSSSLESHLHHDLTSNGLARVIANQTMIPSPYYACHPGARVNYCPSKESWHRYSQRWNGTASAWLRLGAPSLPKDIILWPARVARSSCGWE